MGPVWAGRRPRRGRTPLALLNPDFSCPRTRTGEPISLTPCFSSFPHLRQTAEAVAALWRARHTPLKRGVNQRFVVLPIRLTKYAGQERLAWPTLIGFERMLPGHGTPTNKNCRIVLHIRQRLLQSKPLLRLCCNSFQINTLKITCLVDH